jgi:uncharacterized protein with von Willebrand factor type A (vWA) domain
MDDSAQQPATDSEQQRLRRWRLVLGSGENDGTNVTLSGVDQRLDAALGALYDSERSGGLGASSPNVARWLGDIRQFFPASVVQVLQRDALERLELKQMLLQPELLELVTPDVQLAATLISLKNIMPNAAKEAARSVVRQVVHDLQRRLNAPLRQAVLGSLNRSSRTRRPRHNEIDWSRTIRANLRHYQPSYRTIVPETRIGFGRRRQQLREVVLCVDQSGSMASSVVYSGVFAAALASLPALNTRMVVFDTAVVDLSEQLSDPVDLLFGVQLGGGTDIGQALAYCQSQIQRPTDTIFILISDLYEGGSHALMVQRAQELVSAGVQMIALLALSDDGKPAYHHQLAQTLANMGVPAFACTPDLFPELMATAINRQDVQRWAAGHGIVAERAG